MTRMYSVFVSGFKGVSSKLVMALHHLLLYKLALPSELDLEHFDPCMYFASVRDFAGNCHLN